MGALYRGSQWIIFGLSSYSLYAETGTAINRLLLHFLPVFVLTIVCGMAGGHEKHSISHAPRAVSSAKTKVVRYALTTSVLLSVACGTCRHPP